MPVDRRGKPSAALIQHQHAVLFESLAKPTAHARRPRPLPARTALQVQQPRLVLTASGKVLAGIHGNLFTSGCPVIERDEEVVIFDPGSIVHPRHRTGLVGCCPHGKLLYWLSLAA